jgi:hypothetical protein
LAACGPFASALVYRALGTVEGDDIVWFWIGSHADYHHMLKR